MAVKQHLLIAAVSARPFAEAANVSGYRSITLDIFTDKDTQQLASQFYAVAYRDGGFDDANFADALNKLDLSGCVGAVYGSGFEQRTELLESLAGKLPLLGNTVSTVKQFKHPQQFFGLLDQLDIQYPDTRFERPENMHGWLRKYAGGSGGTHITVMTSAEQGNGEYYQKCVAGDPVSLLFAADGKCIREIGFNLQHYQQLGDLPYCYAGAVSHWQLDDDVKSMMIDIANRLTAATGLVGLNSLDVIVDGQQVYVLEVNPRLTATVGLYKPALGSMMDVHLQAVKGSLADCPEFLPVSIAHRVVYADESLELPLTFDWPAWVKDIPSGRRFDMNEPICSVLAEARDPSAAIELAESRVKEIKRNLKMEEGRLK